MQFKASQVTLLECSNKERIQIDWKITANLRGFPQIPRAWNNLLLIHHLDLLYYKTKTLLKFHLNCLENSGWRALQDLRIAGLIGGVGAGINESHMIPRFLKEDRSGLLPGYWSHGRSQT